MSDDALWIVDLLEMQIESIRKELKNKRIKLDKFDRLSYGAWAITETLSAISNHSDYVDTTIIRDILQTQYENYTLYYERNKEVHVKYKYALEMIEYIFLLTEVYE